MKSQIKRGIILKRILYKDSDLILKVISEDSSLLTFYVRGAAKSKKRFGGGVLEPTHWCEFVHQPERGDDETWLYLAEAKVIAGFEHLRLSYVGLETAFKLLSTTLKVTKPGTTDGGDLFFLLKDCLENLTEEKLATHLYPYFCARVLKIQGNLPLNSLDQILPKEAKLVFSNDALIEQLKRSDQQINYLMREHLGLSL